MHTADTAPPTTPRFAATIGAIQRLRGRRLPWIATAFGTGVGIYFGLPVEPSPWMPWALIMGSVALAGAAWRSRDGIGPLLILFIALFLGGAAAQIRTLVVAGPVLEFRYHGAVEGRVVHIDRSGSGAVRITLDQVRLDRVPLVETPRRVRLSLHGSGGLVRPAPGARVMTTAFLAPPNGPAEPDGFDFQRHAWFLRLGAVGYTRIPLLLAEPAPQGLPLLAARLRENLSNRLRDRLPGQTGQIAAAITTGDRSGLSDEVTESLRASNLAHLLAISGLHMGLLTGFVFWAVRGGLALIPSIALTHPTRIWAALAAMPFAAAYLVLSGGSVATQRAFVMVFIMLIAICLGRRALSMRSVALAALVILTWRPEALTGPGFQMSFAATGALVLVFGALARNRHGWLRGWQGAVVSLFVSSVVAGLATAPFAAAHFNRIGQFGVLANLLAVPVMGFAVMPMLLIGLMLWPLGLEGPPLAIAALGIDWILGVADRVASLPGAVSAVPAPPWQVFPVLGLSFALAACLAGKARGLSAGLLAGALVIWSMGTRPDVLISADGRLVGWMTPEGRALSREKGAGFVAESWLENDGDGVEQAEAAARSIPVREGLPDIIALRRARDADAAYGDCNGGWVVAPMDLPPAPAQCRVLAPDQLRLTGAIGLYIQRDGSILERHTTERQGRRPWVLQ
ncbi:MAG: ComEC/Rec2 family competence protein [Pseudomonadota bacterium]